ncbi:plastocyanin/azurin family copper-binding protein [Larkinella bovis]|uniref:Plastocyanin/azurin family copper-binding protein n=1 Tax=Larkinella bovis TaxID=683041 RepID=A0ABW0IHA9_9BACT
MRIRSLNKPGIRYLFTVLLGWVAITVRAERFFPPDTTEESRYYQIETIPIPPDIALEVGGLAFNRRNQLGISTRHGEVWILENPYLKKNEKPIFRKFASGLHEALGLAFIGNHFYLAQRGELTRLEDRNGDGKADAFKAIYSWPLSGNYHEYSYGPVVTKDGHMLVTLNLSWINRGASLAKWRGWLLKISPTGEMTPLATGLRSPAGLGINAAGDIFYTENQGDWVGSGRMTNLKPGDFAGNPAGLKWTDDPRSPLSLQVDDVPNSPDLPMHEVATNIPALRLPAIWFPHGLMGVSTSDILIDTTRGGFGPFKGQYFIGDQGHSKVMRVFLEKINGEYQGATFPFREGFSSGVFRMKWGTDHAMFVGMTSRGWSSKGPDPYGLQRLRWTGKMPFEIKAIKAQSDGFVLEFTQPVNPVTASQPASYEITGFTYHYWSKYGSKIINQQSCMVHQAEVAKDRMSVKLVVHGLRKGYIHEVKAAGVQSADGRALLHNLGYYTLNNIPAGKTAAVVASAPQAGADYDIDSDPKRITKQPASWLYGPDISLTVGTKPGLQFDIPELKVKPGNKVELIFNNNDDMLHNLVITQPGDAVEKVGQLALNLGLKGPDFHYVPQTDLVLFHTAILQPETSEKIYFTAPDKPGIYPYVCTFPGHYAVMRGKLIVQ